MSPTDERVARQLELAAAAFAAFGDAVRGVGRAVRRFCLEYDHQMGLLIYGTTPSKRRRMVRDWQRFNRRPALIHNGRKPR
jgi:hypothetical protein